METFINKMTLNVLRTNLNGGTMGRRKAIVIDKVISDEWVDRYNSLDSERMYSEKSNRLASIMSSVGKIAKEADKVYRQAGTKSSEFKSMGLLPIKEAYSYLKSRGYDIMFRAFGGRVERGTIPSYKFGKKRYIPMQFLEELLSTKGNFYNIREAYDAYRKYEPEIELRAFVGRIEKKVIPSIKVGFRRYIPKEAIDSLIHVSRNYHSVAEAIQKMHSGGIKIRKNTFERRLDRGRIPFIKIGGKRYIHSEILGEVIEKEKKL
jgi:hypothetical protein